MERLITEEQFEQVRLHMRDTYDVAEHEWYEEELIEAIYELIAKNDEVLDSVSYCDCEDSHKTTMTTRKCVACKKLVNE